MNRRRNYYERESKVPIFIAVVVVIVIIIGLFVLLFENIRSIILMMRTLNNTVL